MPHIHAEDLVRSFPVRERSRGLAGALVLLARRSDLTTGVLRVALRCITKWYRKATDRSLGKSGAVTSIQRFGSALNLNVHFHIVHLNGVYEG